MPLRPLSKSPPYDCSAINHSQHPATDRFELLETSWDSAPAKWKGWVCPWWCLYQPSNPSNDIATINRETTIFAGTHHFWTNSGIGWRWDACGNTHPVRSKKVDQSLWKDSTIRFQLCCLLVIIPYDERVRGMTLTGHYHSTPDTGGRDILGELKMNKGKVEIIKVEMRFIQKSSGHATVCSPQKDLSFVSKFTHFESRVLFEPLMGRRLCNGIQIDSHERFLNNNGYRKTECFRTI